MRHLQAHPDACGARTIVIKIGDFSKLSRASVKTLRYYDEMGLLKPVEVDRFTGYRYYSFAQLPRLNRVLARYTCNRPRRAATRPTQTP